MDDLRLSSEAAVIRSLGGITILIERPDPTRNRSSHTSEDFAFECDEHIRNDGTFVDLHEAIFQIVD